MNFALSQYRNAKVETASPVQLVVDLYRGAIRFLKQAAAYQKEGKTNERGVALRKAHAIVSELQATLNHSQAPELCEELDRLYDFVIFRISEANVSSDLSLIDAAIDVLTTLESAWSEIAKKS